MIGMHQIPRGKHTHLHACYEAERIVCSATTSAIIPPVEESALILHDWPIRAVFSLGALFGESMMMSVSKACGFRTWSYYAPRRPTSVESSHCGYMS